ncbi:hypothetical protein SD81_028180 [Tolypothrix campylonemoides VB511288]|nr:hypothetical protein SD81_028180 [Tolypothrix campylonemoides VB511288]
MFIVKLCFLGFFLNSANSSGKYDNITIEEIQDEIRKGSIFAYLDERLKGDIDLSLITLDEKRELVIGGWLQG